MGFDFTASLGFPFFQDSFKKEVEEDLERKAFSDYVHASFDIPEGDLNELEKKKEKAIRTVALFLATAGVIKNGSFDNRKACYEALKNRHQQLIPLVRKLWKGKEVTAQEESCLATHLRADEEHFKHYLLESPLYDMGFLQGNKLVIQAAVEHFKKDIPFFNEWLNEENCLLSYFAQEMEPEDRKGFSTSGKGFIEGQYCFAEAVLKNIPPEGWSNDVIQVLGKWIASKDVSLSYIRDFTKKLEKCPADKINKFFDSLSKYIKTKEKISDFSDKGIYSFLSYLKNPHAIQRAVNFYDKHSSLFAPKNGPVFSNEEWEKVAGFLAKTQQGVGQLIKASTKQNAHLIWRLIDKNVLNQNDLEKILKFSIKNDCRDFLMAGKPVHISKDFTCYEELKVFFKTKSALQIYQFLNSFSWTGNTVEEKCDLLKDFVSSKAISNFFCQKLGLFNHWAKAKSFRKILTYCYGENVDLEPLLKMNPKDLQKVFSQQDEGGKTLWHYICQNFERMFFNRRLKELSDSFIRNCLVKDKSGKTPLDYASLDSKFLKKISEKNPLILQKLSSSNIPTAYVPVKKGKTAEESGPVLKLAPAIPETEKPQPVLSDIEQQKKIEQAINFSVQRQNNLIIKGGHRTFGLSCSVLKEIQSDEDFKQDILEQLQKLSNTPHGTAFIVDGKVRWKTFKGVNGIRELAISPQKGHSQGMPRIYFTEIPFKTEGASFKLVGANDENSAMVWVGLKKGDKRDQKNDAEWALKLSNCVGGNWYLCDVMTPSNPPSKQFTIRKIKGGRA